MFFGASLVYGEFQDSQNYTQRNPILKNEKQTNNNKSSDVLLHSKMTTGVQLFNTGKG